MGREESLALFVYGPTVPVYLRCDFPVDPSVAFLTKSMRNDLPLILAVHADAYAPLRHNGQYLYMVG
jgi:hypothetical protein